VKTPDELRHEVEELRASRARIVAAADVERRRIERELHDGAQQHLVALAVNIQLARQQIDSDPAGVAALLDELAGDVREALESVRQLAQDVYPPLLLDRGLVDALRAAAAAAAVPVRVDADTLPRSSGEVEAAVYLCCVEALRNTAVHAGTGARATVAVRQDGEELVFDVTDDGVGFEGDGPLGSGLTNVADRVEALGGSLTVSSQPGRGTRVSGAIPFAAPDYSDSAR
jgi:signal transduction histidine kinase